MELENVPDSMIGTEKLPSDVKFLQTLINLSPDIHYIYDLIERKNVYCSLSILRILGYSVEEVQSSSDDLIKVLMHPDDYFVYVNEILPRYSVLNDNQLLTHKYRMKHKAGPWQILESSEVVYKRLEDGTVVQIFGVIHDITEGENLKSSLLESERMLKESQEIAHIGHWNWNVDKSELTWSDEIFRIFGVSRDTFSISAEAFDRTIHPEDFLTFSQERQKMIESGSELSIEHRIIRPNNEIRYVHERAHVVRDNKEVVRVFGTVQDITERKNVENIKRQYELQLERNQRLESIGLLAGGIAHDFNNLLGGIFGYIDMAANVQDEKKLSNFLAKALATIDSARNLTSQLLTFAKGGVPVKKLDMINPLLKETTEFALSGSNISCSFSISDYLWLCEFDKNQIGQVVNNIVINAMQAMPEGGSIEIVAENLKLTENSHLILPAGNYVKIAITDHGIGIPKEILQKIFDPFFTTKAKGHGLGLASCYSIINRHCGCITVESEPGKGSTFTVYLPASPGGMAEKSMTLVSEHEGSGFFLVMDDEEVIREIVSRMLESFGYSVQLAVNGGEAIALFIDMSKRKQKIAGCILDLTIPGGLGGRETIARIREIDNETPVFVASGYADDPVMADPNKYGFNGSICKPFRMSELAKLLNCHIKKNIPL